MPCSPRRRIPSCHRRSAIDGASHPVGSKAPSRSLTAATAARTTRFCRTQHAPFVLRVVDRSKAKRPTPRSPFAPTLPASTASRPAVVTTRDRPSYRAGRITYTSIPKILESEIFLRGGLDTLLLICPSGAAGSLFAVVARCGVVVFPEVGVQGRFPPQADELVMRLRRSSSPPESPLQRLNVQFGAEINIDPAALVVLQARILQASHDIVFEDPQLELLVAGRRRRIVPTPGTVGGARHRGKSAAKPVPKSGFRSLAHIRNTKSSRAVLFKRLVLVPRKWNLTPCWCGGSELLRVLQEKF